MQTCTSILKSGERRGEMCNRNVVFGTTYCRRHQQARSQHDPNILCSYDPPFRNEHINIHREENNEILHILNGYINVQIRYPVFRRVDQSYH